MTVSHMGNIQIQSRCTKCADEIMEICEELESATPQQILEKLETGILNFISALRGTTPKLLRNGE